MKTRPRLTAVSRELRNIIYELMAVHEQIHDEYFESLPTTALASNNNIEIITELVDMEFDRASQFFANIVFTHTTAADEAHRVHIDLIFTDPNTLDISILDDGLTAWVALCDRNKLRAAYAIKINSSGPGCLSLPFITALEALVPGQLQLHVEFKAWYNREATERLINRYADAFVGRVMICGASKPELELGKDGRV